MGFQDLNQDNLLLILQHLDRIDRYSLAAACHLSPPVAQSIFKHVHIQYNADAVSKTLLAALKFDSSYCDMVETFWLRIWTGNKGLQETVDNIILKLTTLQSLDIMRSRMNTDVHLGGYKDYTRIYEDCNVLPEVGGSPLHIPAFLTTPQPPKIKNLSLDFDGGLTGNIIWLAIQLPGLESLTATGLKFIDGDFDPQPRANRVSSLKRVRFDVQQPWRCVPRKFNEKWVFKYRILGIFTRFLAGLEELDIWLPFEVNEDDVNTPLLRAQLQSALHPLHGTLRHLRLVEPEPLKYALDMVDDPLNLSGFTCLESLEAPTLCFRKPGNSSIRWVDLVGLLPPSLVTLSVSLL